MSIYLDLEKPAKDFITERVIDLPNNYLEFNYPADIEQVYDAYRTFNKLYFNNELPKNIPIYFSVLATRVYGKAIMKFGEGKTDAEYKIMLASIIKNDRKLLNDVLLHEMIHIWQYINYKRTGDGKYLDHTWFDTSGHGKYFIGWIKELNSKGFDVTTDIDVEAEIELDQRAYCLIISASEDLSIMRESDEFILLWSFNDFKDSIESIVEDAQGIAGTSFNTVDYFTTLDSSVVNGVRITKNNAIPKGRVNITIPKDVVDILLGSSLTNIILNKNKIEVEGSSVSDIPSDIVQLVTRFNKEKGKMGIDSWYKNILFNSKDYGYLYRVKGTESKDFFQNKFPKELKEFLRNEWLNITDAQIKRTSLFKRLYTHMQYAVFKAKGNKDNLKLDKREIDDLDYDYNRYFVDEETGKVSADKIRLRKLFKDFYIAQLVKDSKKSQRRIDKKQAEKIFDTVGNRILSGTWMEF